jgi:hypothetical protein
MNHMEHKVTKGIVALLKEGSAVLGFVNNRKDLLYQILCRSEGKLCFTFRDGASGVIDRTVPFTPHAVKHDAVIFVKKQFDKFHHRNMLVCSIRAVAL